MALYFFHLSNGSDTLIDPDGRHIEDFSLVAGVALKEARAMISQDALSGRILLDQYIEVRDEHRKLVHKLKFGDAVTIGNWS